MHYTIKGTRLKLTLDQHAYTAEKVKTLSRLVAGLGESVTCAVEIEKTTRHHRTGPIYRAEIQIGIPRKRFVAEATADSVFAALDEAKDNMRHELQAHKSRTLTNDRKIARSAKSAR
jgi:ribosomal subunit interface protein